MFTKSVTLKNQTQINRISAQSGVRYLVVTEIICTFAMKLQ